MKIGRTLKTILVGFCVVSLCAFLCRDLIVKNILVKFVSGDAPTPANPETENWQWNLYSGELPNYKVWVEEYSTDGKVTRYVSLEALNEKITPYRVGAQDSGDGKILRLVIRESETMEYSCMVPSEGEWEWEVRDPGHFNEITKELTDNLQALVKEAISRVPKNENLVGRKIGHRPNRANFGTEMMGRAMRMFPR